AAGFGLTGFELKTEIVGGGVGEVHGLQRCRVTLLQSYIVAKLHCLPIWLTSGIRKFNFGRDKARWVEIAPDRSRCDADGLELSRPGHFRWIELSGPILTWSSLRHAGAISSGCMGHPM